MFTWQWITSLCVPYLTMLISSIQYVQCTCCVVVDMQCFPHGGRGWLRVVGVNHHSEHSDHFCSLNYSITVAFSRQFYHNFLVGTMLDQWLRLLLCQSMIQIQIYNFLLFLTTTQWTLGITLDTCMYSMTVVLSFHIKWLNMTSTFTCRYIRIAVITMMIYM